MVQRFGKLCLQTGGIMLEGILLKMQRKCQSFGAMFLSATLGKPILRWTDKIRIRLAEINFRFKNRKAKYEVF
jgi:hypothetical protein